MKKSADQMMAIVNNKLTEYDQSTRVVNWSGKSILLSTGKVLENSSRARFIKRIMNTKTDVWGRCMDRLVSGKITEFEIKSKLSAIGGEIVQQKHRNTIKQNLNTGTPWNAGTKGQNIGSGKAMSQTVKDKISAKNSGSGNGMFGIKMSLADKALKSAQMKKKILSGEFTPNSNNRNTHWESTFNNKSYRSSWEALYQYINQDAEYEKLRIEYRFDNTIKIYIVDFVDHVTKQVIEVKPRELCTGEKFQAKLAALTTWAELNKYTLIIADKEWLQAQDTNIDYTKFDNNTARKIKALYETNKKN
jgi:uncharacterized FlaG/YvyC family protein